MIKLKNLHMKKLTILAVAALAISFASCKKDYTCECTATGNGSTATTTVTIKDTKKKAEDACSAKTTASSGGTSVSTTCKIK